ncbi:MAG: tetratricopeptide repeat protein [Chloroflexota bacterium]
MKTPTGEQLKPRSQYIEDAIQLAMESKWEEAVEINEFILENFGADDQAYNRLGKALTELGRLEQARDQYEKSLKLNPFNTVAKKNRSKLEVLIQHKDDIKTGNTRVDLNLFVEEMGKTVITQVEGADPGVCDKVVPGDIAELSVTGDTITVTTLRGIDLGHLEAKLARRLIKFMQGGNRYQAGVTNCDGSQIRVIVRETYQDAKFAGKPSFPMRAKREVAFRPYARESLIQRDAEFPADDDEADIAHATVEMEIEEDDGMHEVEEDAEPVDFADEGDSSSDDDDEDDK